MEIKKFKHEEVAPNGNVKSGGAVVVKGFIRMGRGESCGASGCHCSDGYWISISSSRTSEGIVEGLAVYFDSKEEFDQFMASGSLIEN